MKVLEISGFSIEEKYLDSKLEELKILAILFLPAETEPQVLYMLPKHSTTYTTSPGIANLIKINKRSSFDFHLL